MMTRSLSSTIKGALTIIGAAFAVASCATPPALPLEQNALGAMGLSDDLIAAGIEAELMPSKRQDHLRLLADSCDQDQLEACAALIGLMPAGPERAARRNALSKRRAETGYFVWRGG